MTFLGGLWGWLVAKSNLVVITVSSAAAALDLQLAEGFKGPADFCVVPGAGGSMTVVVPDLPQSQLRFIHLRK